MLSKRVKAQKMRDKISYLSFAQSNIARMANCSCAVKGAFCAIAAGLLALFQQGTSTPWWTYPVVLFAVALAFSVFDSAYLQLERRYRVLYRLIDESIDGSFPTSMVPPEPSICDGTRRRDAYLSWSVAGFYMVLCALCVVASFLISI